MGHNMKKCKFYGLDFEEGVYYNNVLQENVKYNTLVPRCHIGKEKARCECGGCEERCERKLDTIQKIGNLNDVYVYEPGQRYLIRVGNFYKCITFQNGPRNEKDSSRGIMDSDLLEIVRDRLKNFQNGEFSCKENEQALMHIEEALMWLNRRVEDRYGRNVLGYNHK